MMTTLPPIDAIADLVRYQWSGELNHYAEQHGVDPDDAPAHARGNADGDHIFVSLIEVADWLGSTEPSAAPELAA